MDSRHRAKLKSLVSIKPYEAGIRVEKENTSYCGKVYLEKKEVDIFSSRAYIDRNVSQERNFCLFKSDLTQRALQDFRKRPEEFYLCACILYLTRCTGTEILVNLYSGQNRISKKYYAIK